ncbi:MAG TPA: acyltransferase [Saprospiraceae bacterium]|nr:acyltransferase [Saprospiraceae bacterium]
MFSDTKPHYEILDGLRGIASLMVVLFHIFEIFSGGDHTRQMINHGYLAVDFFFLLSGFVIAHAYDDRWSKMTIRQFFTRRLIRLHPMIIAGMAIGAICFYASSSPELFPPIAATPVWKLTFVMLAGFLLIPLPLSLDIRGWTEMYPLNGPAWTLFYEYVANVLYAVFLRKTSVTILSVLVVIAGVALAHYTITSPNGDIIGGWALTGEQMRIGFTRLLYPFLAGLLLSRLFRPVIVKNAFLLCSLLIVFVLSFPRIGAYEHLWLNGLYDSFIILIVFPVIVFLGAGGIIKRKATSQVCTFLGNISYPLYITHFPIAYIFYAWVVNNELPLEKAWPAGLLVLLCSILLAYVIFRWYDVPVRRWLTARYRQKHSPDLRC